MGSAENGGGQHPAPEGRKIGTPLPRMFLTPSLTSSNTKYGINSCQASHLLFKYYISILSQSEGGGVAGPKFDIILESAPFILSKSWHELLIISRFKAFFLDFKQSRGNRIN